MRITCGIPARNAGATLAGILSALGEQTREPDEILVADDASTDDTRKIAESLGARCLPLASHSGVAAGRNAIWREADTDILLYIDADAVPEKDLVGRVLAGFTGEDVGGVGGRGIEAIIDGTVNSWRARVCPQSHGMDVIEDDWMLMGLCFAFRLKVLREVGGFDESFQRNGEDVDLSLRVRSAGYRLRYLPDLVVHHQRRDTFSSLMAQGFRHSRYAARALRRNGESAGPLLRDTAAHLARTSLDDLRRGRVADSFVGATGLAFRLVGFAFG